MATFSVKNVRNLTTKVAAAKFTEEGSLVVFRDESEQQVYAIPTSHVQIIERDGS